MWKLKPPGQAEPLHNTHNRKAPEPLKQQAQSSCSDPPFPRAGGSFFLLPDVPLLLSPICAAPRDSGGEQGQQHLSVPKPQGQAPVSLGLSRNPLWQGRLDPQPVKHDKPQKMLVCSSVPAGLWNPCGTQTCTDTQKSRETPRRAGKLLILNSWAPGAAECRAQAGSRACIPWSHQQQEMAPRETLPPVFFSAWKAREVPQLQRHSLPWECCQELAWS